MPPAEPYADENGNAAMNTSVVPMRERVHFHAHADAEGWADASATAIAYALGEALRERERARLLLSGGGTPAPVYRALSQTELDWPRVDVGLVDERWLQPDDPDSNARLVRETLLQGPAAAASFQGLTRVGQGIEEAVRVANLHAHQAADVVVLGMGPDGHTASLFPHMRLLDDALAAPQAYVAVDASGCPGAGRFARRISLTPAGLAPSHARFLLIRGEAKRALFERAVEGTDVRELPIRVAFTTPGASLQVHWAP
jgi:6-phosphogluconolactonase